jgi:hypothetical protein
MHKHLEVAQETFGSLALKNGNTDVNKWSQIKINKLLLMEK